MQNQKKRYTYITALTNEKYIPGVRALAKSLKKAGSNYKLTVLTPVEKHDVFWNNREFCRIFTQFDNCINAEAPNIEISDCERQKLENPRHYWADTFFKLQVTGCTQYEKVVLLDSDMLILKNIDQLFDLPNMSAAVAGECRQPDWTELNSGIMVIEPNTNMHDELIAAIEKAIKQRAEMGMNCGDQDVFHTWFPQWRNHKELHLDEKYNVFFRDIKYLLKQRSLKATDLYVIHFIGSRKPWMLRLFDDLQRKAAMLLKCDFISLYFWCKYRCLCK